jgi:hypothetical protein
MAATMVLAAPGGAAAPTKEYSATFEMPCSIANGLVHATLKVETTAKGPESVAEGETFELTEATSTVHSPPALSTELANMGATHAKGFVKKTMVKSVGSTPASENIAVTKLFPEGLPYEAPVESGKEQVFTAPDNSSYSFPEPVSGSAGYTVTGAAGTNTELIIEHVNGGIESTLEAFNASNTRVLNTTEVCEPPETHLGMIPIRVGASTSTSMTTSTSTSGSPPCPSALEVTAVEPNHGPLNGVTVHITGCGFEEVTFVAFEMSEFPNPIGVPKFTVISPTLITAVTPGPNFLQTQVFPVPATVVVCTRQACRSGPVFDFEGPPPPPPPPLTHTYANWPLSGSLTPRKLGQALNLPSGSTFSGSAEASPSSSPGPGKLTGSVSIPPFRAPLKLFGLLPVSLGLSLTETAPLEGSILTNGIGNATLTIPAKLNMGITSIGFFGLQLPLSCAATEPIALELATRAVDPETLLSKGWEFSGTMTLPQIECGGPLGSLLGTLLSLLLSGPENTYALRVSPPGG